MKPSIIFLLLVIQLNSTAQQSYSEILGNRQLEADNKSIKSFLVLKNKKAVFDKTAMSTFGLYGIGNLNKETAEGINASGKFSGYVRPIKKSKSFMTIYFSYNRNASNSDSLLATTFLFPEIGSSSFLTTLQYDFKIGSRKDLTNLHTLGPLFEFSTKEIKSKDSSAKYFNILNYVVGVKYRYQFATGKDVAAFAIIPYFSFINIPNEDLGDYISLFNQPTLRDNINSAGIKVAFQYNSFQIFADLRHVFGDEIKVPPRELRGFNSNIGVVFNAEIFEK